MRCPILSRAPILLTMVIAAFSAPAGAVVTEWRFPVNGAYNVAGNWSTGIPVSGDIALFNIAGTYTVSFPGRFVLNLPSNRASDQVLVNRGSVSFVDFLDPPTAQVPNPYTVNSIVIAPLASVSAQLSTTLGDFNVGSVSIADAAGSTGLLNVNGGELSVAGTFTLGNLSTGFLNVTGGGRLIQTSGNATIGKSVGAGFVAAGGAVVTGAGSTWSTNGLVVGFDGFGSLSVENGGTVTSSSGNVGSTNSNTSLPPTGPTTRTGVVTVGGTGSTWTSTGSITVGTGNVSFPSQGTLNINLGGTVTTSALNVNSNGSLHLNGGQLNVGSLGAVDPIQFNAGTLKFTGSKSFDDNALDLILGGSHSIGPLRHLAVANTATLNTSVVLNGGTFSAGQLVNGPLLHLGHGTVNITNEAIAIEPGGVLGDTLDLASDMTVNVTLGLTNRGLVTGDGQIGGPFVNDTTGELRAEPGRSLSLTGAGIINNGQINLLGGLLDVTQGLTNSAGALVSGNGTLRAAGGFTNHGVANFSGLANVVGPVTNAATGKIVASGGGPTTFFDDVTNDGEISTSPGAFSAFFGEVSGAGSFTGTGTVNFEGDLSPGNSPALVSFDGNVQFGQESTLTIELGGTTRGTEYDYLEVAGQLSLGGTLEVAFIDDFTPSAGATFDLLDWGTTQGTFAEIVLPPVSGLAWDTSQLYTTGVLGLAAAGIPGDYNDDGVVDAGDYVVWRNRLGSPISLPNDATPGVTVDDYLVWKTHFSPEVAGIALATVPEPSSIFLCGAFPIAMVFWLFCGGAYKKAMGR